MDITTTELKTMKAKQLRRLIQEAIAEILNETTISTTVNYKNASIPDKVLNIDPSDVDTINNLKKDPTVGSISMANKKIKEGEIDELAANPKTFSLANPNMNTTPFANQRVSGVSIADILNFIHDNPNMTEKRIQTHFGFKAAPQVNAIMSTLWKNGVLNKYRLGTLMPLPTQLAPGEEPEETAPTQSTEPEDMFMGNAENPLSMYFDNEPNADGEEDFNDDEEPTVDDMEKSAVSASSISDEDYEAWMKYGELKQRLDSTKSNITKLRKGRSGGMMGDISDKPSTEVQRLLDLRASLEERIATLVASSPYLQAKLKKEEPKAPAIKPEDLEVEPLDEWTISKMQYYAGIRK